MNKEFYETIIQLMSLKENTDLKKIYIFHRLFISLVLQQPAIYMSFFVLFFVLFFVFF